MSSLFFVSTSALAEQSCDRACLTGIADSYMAAMVSKDQSSLPWADEVRYTENGVPMMIGEGAWGSVTGVSDAALRIADPETGEVLWLGIVEDHGQPSYQATRIKAQDGRISEVEIVQGRKEAPGPFAPAEGYAPGETLGAPLAEGEQTRRRRMIALVRGYYETRERNDGHVETRFAPDCEERVNGLSTTQGDYWSAKAAQGCQAQYAAGVWKGVDRIRDRRIAAVDLERGLVAAVSYEDHAVRETTYQTTDGKTIAADYEFPNTRGRIDVFKIAGGEIARVESVAGFLPYYMRSVWTEPAGRRGEE